MQQYLKEVESALSALPFSHQLNINEIIKNIHEKIKFGKHHGEEEKRFLPLKTVNKLLKRKATTKKIKQSNCGFKGQQEGKKFEEIIFKLFNENKTLKQLNHHFKNKTDNCILKAIKKGSNCEKTDLCLKGNKEENVSVKYAKNTTHLHGTTYFKCFSDLASTPSFSQKTLKEKQEIEQVFYLMFDSLFYEKLNKSLFCQNIQFDYFGKPKLYEKLRNYNEQGELRAGIDLFLFKKHFPKQYKILLNFIIEFQFYFASLFVLGEKQEIDLFLFVKKENNAYLCNKKDFITLFSSYSEVKENKSSFGLYGGLITLGPKNSGSYNERISLQAKINPNALPNPYLFDFSEFL